MWKNILQCDKLQTGDVLEVKGKVPFFNHYAVVFYKNNIIYVAHCVDEGVTIETLEQFEKKRTLFSCFRNEVTKKLTNEYIESKAKELSAYGYNFIEMNCEDFVKRIVGTYIGLDDRVGFGLVVSIIIIVSLITVIVVLIRRR